MAVEGVGSELVSVLSLLLLNASFVTKSPGLFVTRNQGVPENSIGFTGAWDFSAGLSLYASMPKLSHADIAAQGAVHAPGRNLVGRWGPKIAALPRSRTNHPPHDISELTTVSLGYTVDPGDQELSPQGYRAVFQARY